MNIKINRMFKESEKVAWYLPQYFAKMQKRVVEK